MSEAPGFELSSIQDVERGLKDFQRDTVEHVFRRLYLDPDRTRRFLVADEVGLGKTLVARGVIARAIRHLWDDIDRIDVVYICSNQDIARQNVNRLNVTGDHDFALASRITLLPTELSGLRENKVNFVSFTPGTSFNLRSHLGKAKERVLLYWLLKEPWNLRGKAPLNALQGYSYWKNFRRHVRKFPQRHAIDEGLAEAFLSDLDRQAGRDRAAGRDDLRARFAELCSRLPKAYEDTTNIPRETKRLQREVVGDLRWHLAVSCIEALEPDLVILDEFQRFKDLLVGDDDAALLARELFNYSDHVAEVRTLLLSATPYKMYTVSDEPGDDDHYEDFLETLDFLFDDSSRTEEMRQLLTDHRRQLYRLSGGDVTKLRAIIETMEARLRSVMVRTERLAASPDRQGMLEEISGRGVKLRAEDVHGYLTAQEVARHLGHRDVLSYWKSAPYLLSFMEGYKLKDEFRDALEVPDRARELADVLARLDGVGLPWNAIRTYQEVDPKNARLRSLLAETVECGVWRLLWTPPSLPYYEASGPYADAHAGLFTKRLVFSAWRLVPRVIATLVSYEAERRMMRSLETEPKNTRAARKRRSQLLQFTRADGRLTGMPVLGILYPGVTLADACDPLEIGATLRRRTGEEPTADDVLHEAVRRSEALLQRLSAYTDAKADRHGDRAPDEAWYWAAPILLDVDRYPGATRAWWKGQSLPGRWAGEKVGRSGEGSGRWADHVLEARRVVRGEYDFGPPPDDFPEVLATMALGGPGVVALRALSRVAGAHGRLEEAPRELLDAAGSIAWKFRSLYNQPEVIAIVRGLDRAEPYWRRVLEYAVAGNLQATLDEYVHVLRESLGYVDAADAKVAGDVAAEICEALGLRTASLATDRIEVPMDRSTVQIKRERMRAHFAIHFGDAKGYEEGSVARAQQVRKAFNSPFWPFVLATTSVGQEGLDFHTYCHAVVHWNLPSNPVDLEQREGRVHRYKGHAVRKNLARRHGSEAIGSFEGEGDPWKFLFARATQNRQDGASDLIPYWVYPLEDGAKIERHVPALPLTRDRARLRALRRSLAVYRMVFGQPRQDDLVEYLLREFDDDEIKVLLEELRVELGPERERET